MITENEQPVARLVRTRAVLKKAHRQLGTMKGSVVYMAPDFDAPLDDFKESGINHILACRHPGAAPPGIRRVGHGLLTATRP